MIRRRTNPLRARARAISLAAVLLAVLPQSAAAATGRERAAEQIPALMGRILESQEEIRERQSALEPEIAAFESTIVQARRRVEQASSEDEATAALVDYVEAYDQRADLQMEGLRAIQGPIMRMRADANELVHAANQAGDVQETPELRRPYLENQFQGIAAGLSQLARQLGREDEAGVAGSVLQAGWASQNTPELPLVKLGPGRRARLRPARRGPLRPLPGAVGPAAGRATGGAAAPRPAHPTPAGRAPRRPLRRRRRSGRAARSECGKTGDWQELGSMVRRAVGLPSGRRRLVDGRPRCPRRPRLLRHRQAHQLASFARPRTTLRIKGEPHHATKRPSPQSGPTRTRALEAATLSGLGAAGRRALRSACAALTAVAAVGVASAAHADSCHDWRAQHRSHEGADRGPVPLGRGTAAARRRALRSPAAGGLSHGLSNGGRARPRGDGGLARARKAARAVCKCRTRVDPRSGGVRRDARATRSASRRPRGCGALPLRTRALSLHDLALLVGAALTLQCACAARPPPAFLVLARRRRRSSPRTVARRVAGFGRRPREWGPEGGGRLGRLGARAAARCSAVAPSAGARSTELVSGALGLPATGRPGLARPRDRVGAAARDARHRQRHGARLRRGVARRARAGPARARPGHGASKQLRRLRYRARRRLGPQQRLRDDPQAEEATGVSGAGSEAKQRRERRAGSRARPGATAGVGLYFIDIFACTLFCLSTRPRRCALLARALDRDRAAPRPKPKRGRATPRRATAGHEPIAVTLRTSEQRHRDLLGRGGRDARTASAIRASPRPSPRSSLFRLEASEFTRAVGLAHEAGVRNIQIAYEAPAPPREEP